MYFDNRPLLIIETSDNRFYSVRETGDANLAHVWFGIELKHSNKTGFAPKAKARHELVRKAACRVVMGPIVTGRIESDPFARIKVTP